jgi:hypothetical protein
LGAAASGHLHDRELHEAINAVDRRAERGEGLLEGWALLPRLGLAVAITIVTVTSHGSLLAPVLLPFGLGENMGGSSGRRPHTAPLAA